LTARSSGTGFVVADNGYVLTNYHVAGGPGAIKVRIPKIKDPVPAQFIAGDKENDIALIQVKVPKAVRLKPLVLVGAREVRRGEQVAAFGFPLGDLLGTGLKLTTGVISALPEKANKGMLVLDARINPGNSGGPLCDTSGGVVGMIKARFSREDTDSYGGAIPAPVLVSFLRENLKSYKPKEPARPGKPWDEVDQLVSGSVLMILKEK
jgi:S1-C subfamily serine protease